MAVNQINLANGQRAERKLLVTIAEWSEGGESPVREILGTRTPDSAIEYNADIETMEHFSTTFVDVMLYLSSTSLQCIL